MSWDIHKASAWTINFPSVLAVKSDNLRQAGLDLCLRVVFGLVKFDAFGGADTEKAGPHVCGGPHLHGAEVRPCPRIAV